MMKITVQCEHGMTVTLEEDVRVEMVITHALAGATARDLLLACPYCAYRAQGFVDLPASAGVVMS